MEGMKGGRKATVNRRIRIQEMEILFTFLATLCLCGPSSGSEILMVVPTPARSHHNLMDKLAEDLARRGHQVTLITAFPRKAPQKNLIDIIYPNYYSTLMESFKGKSENVMDLQMNPLAQLFAVHNMGLAMTEAFLSTPVIEEFMSLKRKYDVIIGEAFFVEAVLAGFAEKFEAPLIGLATTQPSFFVNYMVENPSPSAVIPSSMLGHTENMKFSERLMNFLFEISAWAYFHSIYLPKQGTIMEKYFQINSSRIVNILANTSLILVNHHHSLAFPRPYVPNMIEIGGYHVRSLEPLPNELKLYLDEAKHGVILFSMGSHLKSSNLPREKLSLLVKVFSRLKQNVLWKLEEDVVPFVPANVKIIKWLPQSDALAHPNIKLFITHGGLLSIIETVVRGVPVLGLPVFGDQPSNMIFAERLGFGKMLSLKDLDEDVFYETITEMVYNKRYRENIKRRSLIMQDAPVSASERAIFWVEYIVRHKGAPHLRSQALNLKWFQLYLLDVIPFIIVVSYFFLRLVIKLICLPKIFRKALNSKPNYRIRKKFE